MESSKTQIFPDVFNSYDEPPENNIGYSYSHDELTGLLNRDGMNQALNYLERNMAGNFAVIALDLDELKPTNDTFGHAVGDKLLQKTAEVLQSTVRTHSNDKRDERRQHSSPIPDTIASRIGGDEFIVILPGVDDLEKAKIVEQRLQQNLKDAGVSASLGTAQHETDTGLSDLTDIADQRMYREKNNKRRETFGALPKHKQHLSRLGAALLRYAGTKPPERGR